MMRANKNEIISMIRHLSLERGTSFSSHDVRAELKARYSRSSTLKLIEELLEKLLDQGGIQGFQPRPKRKVPSWVFETRSKVSGNDPVIDDGDVFE